jgi:hypothetical protein
MELWMMPRLVANAPQMMRLLGRTPIPQQLADARNSEASAPERFKSLRLDPDRAANALHRVPLEGLLNASKSRKSLSVRPKKTYPSLALGV